MSLMDLIAMALQMLWEVILVFPVLSAFIVLLIILSWLLIPLKKLSIRKKHLQNAALTALLPAMIAFFVLPYFFVSSLFELRYLADWLFHFGSVAAVWLYFFLLLIPIDAWFYDVR